MYPTDFMYFSKKADHLGLDMQALVHRWTVHINQTYQGEIFYPVIHKAQVSLTENVARQQFEASRGSRVSGAEPSVLVPLRCKRRAKGPHCLSAASLRAARSAP
jgi:hypothetical protein